MRPRPVLLGGAAHRACGGATASRHCWLDLGQLARSRAELQQAAGRWPAHMRDTPAWSAGGAAAAPARHSPARLLDEAEAAGAAKRWPSAPDGCGRARLQPACAQALAAARACAGAGTPAGPAAARSLRLLLAPPHAQAAPTRRSPRPPPARRWRCSETIEPSLPVPRRAVAGLRRGAARRGDAGAAQATRAAGALVLQVAEQQVDAPFAKASCSATGEQQLLADPSGATPSCRNGRVTPGALQRQDGRGHAVPA